MDLSNPSIVLPAPLAPSRPAPERFLPIEFWIAAFFSCILLIGLNLGLPLNVPDGASLAFVQKHYFSPLLGAFLLQLTLPFLLHRRDNPDRWLMVKLLPFVFVVVLLHFNFKAWMPLVNPRCYDDVYLQVDGLCAPVVGGFHQVRAWIADNVNVNLDHAYHGLFVAMFFVSLAFHAAFDSSTRQRQLVLGLSLILLLGGICYWIAPAVGPFLYSPGLNDASQGAQAHMWHMFRSVVETGEIPAGYFTSPLAAMPSLHVAHALFLTLFAFRLRWLFVAYLPILLWIVIESVASGWHYLIDLPFGAILAVFCLSVARGFVPEPPPPGSQDREK